MHVYLNYIDPATGDASVGAFEIENLNFAPQVDLTGNSMPINEYNCDVIFPDGVPGEITACVLYDEMNQPWAEWPLRHVQRISDKCLRVTASSWLHRLEYVELAEEMFTAKTATAAILQAFGGDEIFELTQSIAAKTLTGFVPAQNGRERLTWLLFVLGAFPVDVYRSNVLIRAVDTTEALVPLNRTFARPSVDTAPWVTGLKITTYTFRQAASEDEWQQDDGSYMFPLPWLATEQTFTLANTAAPAGTPENVVEIDGLYLINPSNVSALANRLAAYWFNPVEAQLACINNRQYRPGDLITAHTDPENLITGYIQQETFAFGKQARSAMKLIGVEQVVGAKLTINYMYQGGRIKQAKYYLPVGYTYSISNPVIDRTYRRVRYIYYPQDAAVTGTIVAGENVATQDYDLALKYEDERLTIYSVDAIENQDGTGVIS